MEDVERDRCLAQAMRLFRQGRRDDVAHKFAQSHRTRECAAREEPFQVLLDGAFVQPGDACIHGSGRADGRASRSVTNA